MSSVTSRIARRTHFWGLVCVAWLGSADLASAQIGYGGAGFGGVGYGGYPGFGAGFGGVGYGGYPGFGGGYGGVGYGGIGYGGFATTGYNGYGGVYGSLGGNYGGFPLYSTINAYNLGYNNTAGLGLVPPAYVGTGTAGIGPIGIGGTNPLFGLGLSPLAIHNAVAEQSLRQRAAGIAGSARGVAAPAIRMNLYPPNTPTTPTIQNPAVVPAPTDPHTKPAPR